MWKTIIIIVIAYFFYKSFIAKPKGKTQNKTKNKMQSSNKIEHYKEKGLGESDITVFRQTMNNAKNDIIFWENEIKKDEKLAAIEEKTQGLKSSKQIFKEIVNEPSALTKESEFLYNYLPNMVILVKKYNELNKVRPVNEEIKVELAERLHYVMKLSERITNIYQKMLLDDVNDIKHLYKEDEKEEEFTN